MPYTAKELRCVLVEASGAKERIFKAQDAIDRLEAGLLKRELGLHSS